MTFTATDGDQLQAAFTAWLVAQSDSLIVQELLSSRVGPRRGTFCMQ